MSMSVTPAACTGLRLRGSGVSLRPGRFEHARFVPDEVVNRRPQRLLPDNHPTPEPGLPHVDEDKKET
jgi:hypothetical protein